MPPRPDLAQSPRHLSRPRPTVRGRLAVLYGGVFFIAGIALLAFVYVLVDSAGNAASGSTLEATPVPKVRS